MQVHQADGAAAKVIRDTEGTLNILESGSAFLREATTVCNFGLWDPHRSDAQFPCSNRRGQILPFKADKKAPQILGVLDTM